MPITRSPRRSKKPTNRGSSMFFDVERVLVTVFVHEFGQSPSPGSVGAQRGEFEVGIMCETSRFSDVDRDSGLSDVDTAQAFVALSEFFKVHDLSA